MTKDEKIKIINNVMGHSEYEDLVTYIGDVLQYTYDEGRNMVVSCNGMIMFNKAGTNDEDGSYRESQRDNLEEDINKQSDDCIDFVFSLIDR